MRSLLATAAAVGAIVVVPASAFAKTCSRGYTHASIGGAQKCLHAGEFCALSEARQYRRYGYACDRVGGHYRLERD
jgi:hypothetical protein